MAKFLYTCDSKSGLKFLPPKYQHCTVLSTTSVKGWGLAVHDPCPIFFISEELSFIQTHFCCFRYGEAVWVYCLVKSCHCWILVLLMATSASPKVQMTWVELSMQHGMLQEIYNPIIQNMSLAFPISCNWASLINTRTNLSLTSSVLLIYYF